LDAGGNRGDAAEGGRQEEFPTNQAIGKIPYEDGRKQPHDGTVRFIVTQSTSMMAVEELTLIS
jgi:hypothetical protein